MVELTQLLDIASKTLDKPFTPESSDTLYTHFNCSDFSKASVHLDDELDHYGEVMIFKSRASLSKFVADIRHKYEVTADEFDEFTL